MLSPDVNEQEAIKKGAMQLTALYFHQPYGGYNAGETAGFTPKRVEKLLGLQRNGMPIVEKVSDIEARKAKQAADKLAEKAKVAPATKVAKRYATK